MKKTLSCLVALLLIGLVVTPASAAVITSSGDAWTWDLPQYADSEFGHATTFKLLENAPARTALSLGFVTFDVSGALGAGEQFASAKVNFYISGNTGVNTDIFWLYAIDESADTKVSDSMTLNTQPTTWTEYIGLSAEVAPGTAGTVGWISFDASAILDYARADDDGILSFAVRQIGATGGIVDIVAHEHTSTSVHPQFEYTVESIPEPTTMCLLGLGALGLIRRRK